MTATINTVLAELRAVSEILPTAPTETAFESALARHWAARAFLAHTPATSLDDIQAKAQALRIEIARTTGADGESTAWELVGDGCARHIAESLARDVLALMETR